MSNSFAYMLSHVISTLFAIIFAFIIPINAKFCFSNLFFAFCHQALTQGSRIGGGVHQNDQVNRFVSTNLSLSCLSNPTNISIFLRKSHDWSHPEYPPCSRSCAIAGILSFCVISSIIVLCLASIFMSEWHCRTCFVVVGKSLNFFELSPSSVDFHRHIRSQDVAFI